MKGRTSTSTNFITKLHRLSTDREPDRGMQLSHAEWLQQNNDDFQEVDLRVSAPVSQN